MAQSLRRRYDYGMKPNGDKVRVNGSRVRTLKDGEIKKGPVVYWMSREQRVKDKVRYMSYGGCQSKFDVEAYIKQNRS